MDPAYSHNTIAVQPILFILFVKFILFFLQTHLFYLSNFETAHLLSLQREATWRSPSILPIQQLYWTGFTERVNLNLGLPSCNLTIQYNIDYYFKKLCPIPRGKKHVAFKVFPYMSNTCGLNHIFCLFNF